ncbi:phosphatase PAP2 family protein [Conexibacter sp. JD483]|uniref:phosphatase PAP2 family protein n=1 Tax=unclassified Conexibacter TaxID=2627773 RepID=UPI0027256F21|nr:MULTISPECIES: phosphatase PAP2 family protein [unclassified Conexibacter]MDO8188605.1 phosphatase PAP2 family protein [Conexibacter sp. CPCC 205706]MDO8201495.1 phosphatase PAP2 family protein [Conexibacter sp. CPCC 205762]MDR9370862.1 phosphatase PAP2 family protein [Conexibacter sp. JD483]
MQTAAEARWRPPSRPVAAGAGARAGRARSAAPILEPRAGGRAQQVAAALGGVHPALAFLVVLLAGFAAVTAISTLLGLFVVHVLVGGLGLGGADNSLTQSLAGDRTATWTDLSAIGSAIGGAPVLPIVAALVALAAAFARQWRIAAFAACALPLESAAYRVTATIVQRDRPGVVRLEDLPVAHSYPSGHTAASVAVYCGLALLLTSRIADRAARAAIWAVAIALVAGVALSRMYRGMHHPLDVAGGVVVGVLAVAVTVFACRVAGAVAADRSGR